MSEKAIRVLSFSGKTRDWPVWQAKTTIAKAGRVYEPKPFQGICFRCNKQGHKARDCPEPSPKRQNGQNYPSEGCHYCNKRNHKFADCWFRKRDLEKAEELVKQLKISQDDRSTNEEEAALALCCFENESNDENESFLSFGSASSSKSEQKHVLLSRTREIDDQAVENNHAQSVENHQENKSVEKHQCEQNENLGVTNEEKDESYEFHLEQDEEMLIQHENCAVKIKKLEGRISIDITYKVQKPAVNPVTREEIIPSVPQDLNFECEEESTTSYRSEREKSSPSGSVSRAVCTETRHTRKSCPTMSDRVQIVCDGVESTEKRILNETIPLPSKYSRQVRSRPDYFKWKNYRDNRKGKFDRKTILKQYFSRLVQPFSCRNRRRQRKQIVEEQE